MREIQRRKINGLETDRMIFMLQDEYARFCDPEFDEQFLSTARESKCCCIHLLQSIDQLVYVCGSKEKADALTQNMFLHFILANNGATARWNSELLGKRWDMLEYSGIPLGQTGGGHGGGSKAQVEYLLPHEWHQLKTGGLQNDNLVGCVFFKGGKLLSNGLPYLFEDLAQKPLNTKD